VARPFGILRARFQAVLDALNRFDGLSLDCGGRPTANDRATAAALGQAIDLALATARAEGENGLGRQTRLMKTGLSTGALSVSCTRQRLESRDHVEEFFVDAALT
jgi:hypothetical protein